jgi:hypothetical protein
MKRSALLLIALAAGAPLAAKSFNGAARGTDTAPFLLLPAGARGSALGQAYGASAQGAEAVFWNPAGVNSGPRSAFFSHSARPDGAFADFISISLPRAKKNSAWGFGAEYASSGELPRRNAAGDDMGSYRPYDLAAGVTYARSIGGLQAGVAAKFVRSTLLKSAQTAALDAGILADKLDGGKLRLGASLSNLGGKMKFNEDSESLPLALRASSAFKVAAGLSLSADAVFPKDNKPSLCAGLESAVAVSGGTSLVWRAGYNGRATADLQGFSGYSFGFGLQHGEGFSFDYAFLPMGLAGASHNLSLSRRF